MRVRRNNTLSEWAERVLDEHGKLSLRQAEIRTGVSYSTVKNMLEGKDVAADSIIRFAHGFREDIPAALRTAGYDDIADLWERGERDEARLNGAAYKPGLDDEADECREERAGPMPPAEVDLSHLSGEQMGALLGRILSEIERRKDAAGLV